MGVQSYNIPFRHRHGEGASATKALLTGLKEWAYDETNEELYVLFNDGLTYRAHSRSSLMKAGSERNVSISIDSSENIAIGTAAASIGFFAQTPVAQQAGTGETVGFVAGTGTAVNDDSTFTGNVGITAYRINDIVKALKNYGLLDS